jgi:tRNA nucleotidyltransferase/poly(A) polymerase
MNTKIVLSAREEHVFEILRAAGRATQCTVRAAGGWVRDKLLCRTSDDVDVALDKTDGETFAEAVAAILRTSDDGSMRMSSIGTIRRNPERSKHLNTATFSVDGISIDANNLRSEDYASDSRIPTIRMGTPLEDAERRDFTINALFYNLETREVEDLTTKGISDLEEKILRTPLSPETTFKDDPLRIVRAVRFASRFEMKMASELAQAISDQTIVDALTVRKDQTGAVISKVSGERIGTEIEKMFMNTKTAHIAYRIMTKDTPIAHAILRSIPCFKDERQIFKFPEPQKGDFSDERETKIFYLALLVAPVRSEFVLHAKKEISAATYFLKEILHVGKHEAEIVAAIFSQISILVHIAATRELIPTGKFLRLLKEDWPVAVKIARVLEGAAISEGIENWIREKSGLIDCWHWRPPFDGRVLAEEPFGIPRGPRLAQAIERQLEIMFEGVKEPDAIKRRLLVDK